MLGRDSKRDKLKFFCLHMSAFVQFFFYLSFFLSLYSVLCCQTARVICNSTIPMHTHSTQHTVPASIVCASRQRDFPHLRRME